MPRDIDEIDRGFEPVFHSLSRVELQRGADDLDSLEVQDLFSKGQGLFLGFYSEKGLEHAFSEYGFLDKLAEVGFDGVRVEVQADDSDEHLLRIWSASPSYEAPLLELVARRDTLRPQDELAREIEGTLIPVLTIEWLQMQNPAADFSAARPPFPGQHLPGLGLGAEVLLLLRNSCRRLGLEALVTVPSYFHNAVLYSEGFTYFDPEVQGRYLALVRDIVPQAGASIAAASWALKWSMVRRTGDEGPFEWMHDAMVAPVSDRLREFFESTLFQREVNETLSRERFEIVPGVLDAQLEVRGIRPFDLEKIITWVGEEP